MYEDGRHLERKNRKRSWDIEDVEAKQCMDKQESTSSSSCTPFTISSTYMVLAELMRGRATEDTSMSGVSALSYAASTSSIARKNEKRLR
jgi:activator of 2-hydroxyglutaryl-CoA dehydratase